MKKLIIGLLAATGLWAQQQIIPDPFAVGTGLQFSPTGAGTGTVQTVTIAGTTNQIATTGSCTAQTTTVSCTLSLPSGLVLPGTIDGLTITTTTGTFTLTNAKTFSVGNTLTLTGTDASTINFPAPGSVTSGDCAALNKSGSTISIVDPGLGPCNPTSSANPANYGTATSNILSCTGTSSTTNGTITTIALGSIGASPTYTSNLAATCTSGQTIELTFTPSAASTVTWPSGFASAPTSFLSGHSYVMSGNWDGTTYNTKVATDLTGPIINPALCTGSGTTSAQTCTTTPSFTPIVGSTVTFIPACGGTCGASLTLAVNGASAAGLYKWAGSAAVASGDMVSAKPVRAVFDAAGNWDVDDIGNAPSGGSGTPISVAWCYYGSCDISTGTYFTLTANTPMYIEALVPYPGVIVNNVTMYSQSATSGTVNVGFFDSTCTRIAQGTAQTISAAGVVNWNFASPVTLTAGKYFLGVTSTASNIFYAVPGSGGYANQVLDANESSSNLHFFLGSNASSSGVFQSSCGTRSTLGAGAIGWPPQIVIH